MTQLISSELKARFLDAFFARGNADTLRKYWSEGGANRIRWCSDGDFDRCTSLVRKYLGKGAEGYCNERHQQACGGAPPGHAPQELAEKSKHALDPIADLVHFANALVGRQQKVSTLPQAFKMSMYDGPFAHIEQEQERKFLVPDPSKLPPKSEYLGKKQIIQGYFPDGDGNVSLRVVPKKQKAWLRRKSTVPDATGTRFKIAQKVGDYNQALQMLASAPKVAVKTRKFWKDQAGRLWKIEFFDDNGPVQAETETSEGSLPISLPPWVSSDETSNPAFYSENRAKPRTQKELVQLIADASGNLQQSKPTTSASDFHAALKAALGQK